MHDLAPCDNSKSVRTFLERKGIPVLELLREFTGHESNRERLEYNEERDW